jgi:cytochrome c-type biogenesis protein CcmH
MNNIAIFIGSALLLAAAALLLVLSAFRRRAAGADFSRKQLNAAIYRDELAELESDLAAGALTQADYDQARAELQRRLLEDSTAGEATATAAPSSLAVPIGLAATLPVAATLLYLALGNPAALSPQVVQQQQFTEADIERMVTGLAAKLEQEPDNFKGWAMLARSYKAMGRLPEALRAYERTGSLMDSNPDLVLDYADTLAATSGGFNAKVLALIDKALKLDPAHPQGLWLRGTAFYETKQYDKALKDWEALLKLMPPGSDNARTISANIAEVKELQATAGKQK